MPFKPAQCLALTELTVLQYFKTLHNNVDSSYNQALQIPISLNKTNKDQQVELDASNKLLLDYYENFIDFINVSLTIKRQIFLDASDASEKNETILRKSFEQFVTSYEALKTKGDQEILDYWLDSSKKFPPGRSTLYYFIITAINHNNHWCLTELLTEWITALKFTSQDPIEHQLLDFFEFILPENNGIPVALPENLFIDFYNRSLHPYELYHAYIKDKKHKSSFDLLAKFSGRKEDFPQLLAEMFKSPMVNLMFEQKHANETIEPFIHHPCMQFFAEFPKFSYSVPAFVVVFLQTYLTTHLLSSVYFDSKNKEYYLELIEHLTKHGFLQKTPETISELKLFSNLVVFVDKLMFSSINYMLIPTENLYFFQIRNQLIQRQIGLFNLVCEKRVSPQLIKFLIQGLDVLLSNPKHYKRYQFSSRDFWFSVARIFITENQLDPQFVAIVGKHIYLALENFYLHDLEIVANGMLVKFVNYELFKEIVKANSLKKIDRISDNPLKTHFTNSKAKQLLEFSRCIEFLSMLPRIDEDPRKFDIRFERLVEFLQKDKPLPKYLNFYFFDSHFKSLPTILKNILLIRIPLLSRQISECKNHDTICIFAQMVFKIALILQLDEQERSSLEAIFNLRKTDESLRSLELALGYDRQEPEALLYINTEEDDDESYFELATHDVKDDGDEKSPVLAQATSCSFFKPAEKNIIAKHLVPSPLLQLTALINQVFSKELVLRGGAVMDLLTSGSIEAINDYDPIVFNIELDKIQLALQNHCFALSELSQEEFIQLKIRVRLNKYIESANKQNYALNVLSIKQAQELQKACLSLPQIAEKIVCTPVLQGEIIGQGSRRALVIEHQGIHIDLVNFSTPSKKFAAQIKAYQQSGDFEISSLHMVLDLSADHFVIDGAPQALLAAHQQCISIVYDKTDIFSEDPIRLFRLIKEMLKKPHFSLDFKLLKLIKQTDFNALFTQRFQENLSLYRGRVSMAFSKLFDYFPITDVLAAIQKLGVFENIFALNHAELSEHFSVFDDVHTLTAYQKKMVFFELIYAHLCHHYPDDAQRNALPITQVVRQVAPEDRIKIEYIESWVLGKDHCVFVNDAKLSEILIMFPNLKATSALSLSS